MTTLHARIRTRGLAIFVDVRALAKALRGKQPLAVARRRAEYVLIDHQRIPLGFDDHDFVERHLARVHHARHGMGFTAPEAPKVTGELPAPPLPSLHVRIATRREDRAATDSG